MSFHSLAEALSPDSSSGDGRVQLRRRRKRGVEDVRAQEGNESVEFKGIVHVVGLKVDWTECELGGNILNEIGIDQGPNVSWEKAN